MSADPGRLVETGLPGQPLLRAYARATMDAIPPPPLRRPTPARSRAALASGLAAAFLGAWLVVRAPASTSSGLSGTEGKSGTRDGTGGVSGSPG